MTKSGPERENPLFEFTARKAPRWGQTGFVDLRALSGHLTHFPADRVKMPGGGALLNRTKERNWTCLTTR
jgi:hypothetical protein